MSLGFPNALTIFTIIDNSCPVSGDTFFLFKNLVFESETISAELELGEDFPFFDGHFPKNPILPAVCIIDASLALLSQCVPELSTENIHLKRCRFAATIGPNENVRIRAEKVSESNWKFQWLGTGNTTQDSRSMAELNVLL